MNKFLSYMLSPVYWLYFSFLLLIFHAIQVVCHHIGGNNMRKKAVDLLNFLLMYGLNIVGAKITFKGFDKLPTNKPLIIISNHQSSFDIPPIVWAFRKHHPKFISKQELGRGIPSISYNLRKSGSALIDRKNRKQAILEISKLGKTIESNQHSVSIFPEGTRTKNGNINTFKYPGIAALVKNIPSAVIIPMVIEGNYELMKDGYFSLALGTKLNYTALPAITPQGKDIKELTKQLEDLIKQKVNKN